METSAKIMTKRLTMKYLEGVSQVSGCGGTVYRQSTLTKSDNSREQKGGLVIQL